ncbi:hypothetical protein CI258_001655 [Enterococcus faecium]|nr:hypothetical protein CI258_001655 [Enterococcus faecium]
MSNHDDLHFSPSLLFGIWFDHTTYNATKKQGTVTKVVSKSLVPNKRCSRSSFFFLEADHFFYDLLVNGVPEVPSYFLKLTTSVTTSCNKYFYFKAEPQFLAQ